MRRLNVLATVVWLCWDARYAAAAPGWHRVDIGSEEGAVLAVRVHPTRPARVYAATRRSLYESADGGLTWRARFHPPAGRTVTDIAVSGSEEPAVLVATDRGLYGLSSAGSFRFGPGAGDGEALCTRVAFHPGHPQLALLGTQGGLFLSPDQGRRWTEVATPPSARHILDFAFSDREPDRVHLLATEGLFFGNLATGQWRQSYGAVGAASEPAPEPEESDDEFDTAEPAAMPFLRTLAVHPREPSTIYLGTARGLHTTSDYGRTWHRMTQAGLLSSAISRILLQSHSPPVLYAATHRGVARYDSTLERWRLISQDLANIRIHDLVGSPRLLWAATERGLYRYEIGPDALTRQTRRRWRGAGGGSEGPGLAAPEDPAGGPKGETAVLPSEETDWHPFSAQELLGNFSHEPTIAEVREAAIRYAEVHPDKIRRWRRRAALRALLPRFDVGFDHDQSRDTSVDEGSFPNFQLIDTMDRDAGFNFSANWELGDLIWSGDQTSIDTRSKLMVQLRDEIVDEVTRTYFERRRLQLALLTDPPGDQRTVLEKELRLQELAALIDGLTGGYFSGRIKPEADVSGRSASP